MDDCLADRERVLILAGSFYTEPTSSGAYLRRIVNIPRPIADVRFINCERTYGAFGKTGIGKVKTLDRTTSRIGAKNPGLSPDSIKPGSQSGMVSCTRYYCNGKATVATNSIG